ncbi:MAG: ATP-binding cassette domain-containing protein [Euryarchaeota archaeon]|nr:ATP-binding cassette domain-containing protein [Euryarchaeota archaeon]
MLSLRDLSVYRGDLQIIRHITADFEQNRVHVILGVNGSGKSTLAGGIMGIYPTTGSVKLNGEEISRLPVFERARRGLTLAFQDPARFEGLRVKDYLLVSSKEKKLSDVLDAIRIVGLSESILSKKMDDSLSGGERKRVELASVLLMKPKVVILDEPDSGIDMVSYHRIRAGIEALRKEACVLLITHNKELVFMGDYAYLLHDGRIIRQGMPGEIKEYFEQNFTEGVNNDGY